VIILLYSEGRTKMLPRGKLILKPALLTGQLDTKKSR
jgi:hypothetical protein